MKKYLLAGALALALTAMATGCGNNTESTPANGGLPPYQDQGATQDDPAPADTPGADITDAGDASDGGDISDTPAAAATPADEFDFSHGLTPEGFVEGITARDHVSLFQYSGLVIPADVHQVDQADLDNLINNMLGDFSTTEMLTTGEVQMGDTINIDFVGSTDGVEFDGGSTHGMGMDVTIGVTNFIDDFLYQLIGHSPGTTLDVNVTFPDSYPQQPALEGAPALFVTTINHIVGEPILPELTDDFIAAEIYPMTGFATVAEMTAGFEEFLQNNAIQAYIADMISDAAHVAVIPPVLIERHSQELIAQHTNQAAQFGIDLETMLEWSGFDSVEDLIADSMEDIEREARGILVLQAIAEELDITVTREDVEAFFEENFGSPDITMFEEMYGLPWLMQFIRNNQALEYVIDNAVHG